MTVADHPTRVAARERGELAASMVWKACLLAGLVRDSDRDTITEFLAPLSDEEKDALLVVQAGLIPDDKTPEELLAWVTWDEYGRPLPGPRKRGPAPVYSCGSYAAWRRHKRNDEPTDKCGCDAAQKAYRKHLRDQHRAARQAADAAGGPGAPNAAA